MRWSAGILLLLAACSRELSIPAARTIAVAPTFATAAPRERVVLSASGGAGGYAFAFAQGGRLSGDDASLTAVPGEPGQAVYRAGSAGSALDVVEVRDAAGATASVRVSVGSRLRVTPSLAVSAPGATLTLAAVGGKAPYAFELVGAQGGTQLQPGVDPESREVVLGPLGDRIEKVVVTDATFDPADALSYAAEATIQISGAIRLYANAPARVPPHETVDFLAVGGQPPYAFDFAAKDGSGAPPSGGTIDPVSGRYHAGPAGAADGSVADEIVVRDALGQASAPWRIEVGAPLSLELPAADLSPDVPVQLVASGGKPPYTFGFAARGNRSFGTVNAASGEYTPGPNQGTSDVLQVWDATGIASAALSEPARVGFVEIVIGLPTGRAIAARLRGDRRPDTGAPREDVVITHYDGSPAGVSALLLPPDLPPRVVTGYLAQAFGMTFAVDLDGDHHDEVIVLGSSGLVVLETDVAGNLSFSSQHYPPTPPATSPYVQGASQDPLEPTVFHLTNPCTCSAGTYCPAPGGDGVMRVDVFGGGFWWECDLLPPDAASQSARDARTFTAGDWDGDGLVDLAWAQPSPAPARVYVSFREVTGVLGAAQQLVVPDPCALQGAISYQSDGRLVSYRYAPSGGTRSYPVLSVVCPDGAGGARQKVLRLDGNGGGTRVPTFSPASPVDLGRAVETAANLRPSSPTTGATQQVLAFGGLVYDIHAVSFDGAGAATVVSALPRPLTSTVQWVGLPDVNGDEIPDLLAAGTNSIARLMLGDGDGRFGWRPRFQHLRNWAVGDVDGDGLDDVVGTDSSPAMFVGLGGGHQLAWATPRWLPAGGAAIAAGDFGFGREIVHTEFAGAVWRTRVNADGSLQPPEAVTLPFPMDTIRMLRAADFGADGTTDFWSNTQGFGALLFTTRTSARWYTSGTPGWGNCAYLPAGAGTPAWPVEAVALCQTNDWELRLFRNSIEAGLSFGPWVDVTPAGMPPGSPDLTSWVLAAGTWGGKAWFVAAPGGVNGVRHLYALSVAAGAAHEDPLVVTTIDLGVAPRTAPRSALVGDVDGVDGVGELLLLREGSLRVLRPDGAGGAAEVARVGAAGGSIDGLLRLGPGPQRDVLLRAADHGLLLRNEGGVSLR